MSSRFIPRRSSVKTGERSDHFLFSDPECSAYSDKTRRRRNSKAKIKNSTSNVDLSPISIRLTLRFKQLLLKIIAKRDTLFHSSVFVFAFVLLLSYRLNQTGAVRTRSIPHKDLSRFFSSPHPVTIRFDGDSSETLPRQVRFHHTIRKIKEWTEEDEERQQNLWNEEKYEGKKVGFLAQPYKDMPECKPMHEWQKSQFPTCTVIHEQRLIDKEFGKFLASGAFRQTFEIYDRQSDSPVAMKTIRDRHKENLFTPHYLDTHRIDALIYERTSASPWITDIYGFCGLSGLFEFAGGGTMEDVIIDEEKKKRKFMTRMEKLAWAVDATSAIADLHTIDSINGYSAMMHGDIDVTQFVRIGNRFKLNDFNRGHLMYWDEKKQESCPYAWNYGHNGNVSSLPFCPALQK